MCNMVVIFAAAAAVQSSATATTKALCDCRRVVALRG